jgi:hypothetical protein
VRVVARHGFQTAIPNGDAHAVDAPTEIPETGWRATAHAHRILGIVTLQRIVDRGEVRNRARERARRDRSSRRATVPRSG